MDKFTTFMGIAAPLPMINVDTDKIIPAVWLKTIKRTGLGPALFEAIRYKRGRLGRSRFRSQQGNPTATPRSW